MTRPASPSRKSERQARILAELRATPSLRVNDLSARLAVSTETVRRDLAQLDNARLINRTYGGALRSVQLEPGIAEREPLMVEERRRIARAALRLVAPNDTLMIGGGATTLHFARALAVETEHLTIITHGFSIAAALAANRSHRVIMLPGLYDGREGLIHGPETLDALLRFNANKAFLGASGVTGEGPNDAAPGPGTLYGAMMRRAARAIILADHRKFGATSLLVYGCWSPSVSLVTDQPPPGALAAALAVSGAEVIVAGPGA